MEQLVSYTLRLGSPTELMAEPRTFSESRKWSEMPVSQGAKADSMASQTQCRLAVVLTLMQLSWKTGLGDSQLLLCTPRALPRWRWKHGWM